MQIIYERKTETFLFFLRGIFSNFQRTSFIYKGHKFANTEQAFMWCKATFFKDDITAEKILKEKNPAAAKKLGREVSNYIDSKWDKVRESYMYEVNKCKYSQNKELKDQLLKTKNLILVEVNPRDRIWGIGLSADDDRILNTNNWKGKNLLGKVLMQIRKELASEETNY